MYNMFYTGVLLHKEKTVMNFHAKLNNRALVNTPYILQLFFQNNTSYAFVITSTRARQISCMQNFDKISLLNIWVKIG